MHGRGPLGCFGWQGGGPEPPQRGRSLHAYGDVATLSGMTGKDGLVVGTPLRHPCWRWRSLPPHTPGVCPSRATRSGWPLWERHRSLGPCLRRGRGVCRRRIVVCAPHAHATASKSADCRLPRAARRRSCVPLASVLSPMETRRAPSPPPLLGSDLEGRAHGQVRHALTPPSRRAGRGYLR